MYKEDGVLAKMDQEVVKNHFDVEQAEAEFINLVQSFNDDDLPVEVQSHEQLTLTVINGNSERKRSTARYGKEDESQDEKTLMTIPKASLNFHQNQNRDANMLKSPIPDSSKIVTGTT
jgi:hypothetical protein